MSHPHAAHCRVHPNEFCQSSAPGGQAVTWVPSGVGSSGLTGGQLFQAGPFGRFRSNAAWFSSELELYCVGGMERAIISVGPTELKMWGKAL